jgi:circadian clock protein KaiC
VIRNLSSVGISLKEHVDSGLLRIVSARTINGSAETYLVRIKSLAEEHGARCLVVDPVSSLSKSGNALTANSVVERLIHWAKAHGMTLICTSLLDEMANQSDGASTLRVSTLADTWIDLNYLVQAGERNRGMSIIKSRGTAHSNQVRELVLSERGVTLTDTYSAGGEVLMGTLRWEKERAERANAAMVEMAASHKRVQLDAEEAELEVRLRSLEVEILAKQAEKALLAQAKETREQEDLRGRTQVKEMRGADEAPPRPV